MEVDPSTIRMREHEVEWPALLEAWSRAWHDAARASGLDPVTVLGTGRVLPTRVSRLARCLTSDPVFVRIGAAAREKSAAQTRASTGSGRDSKAPN